MGRKAKVLDGQVCALRLPKAFLDQKPADEETGDWLRGMLIDHKEVPEVKAIAPEEKEACAFFYKLFNKQFEEGKLDDLIDSEPKLLEYANAFKKVAQ